MKLRLIISIFLLVYCEVFTFTKGKEADYYIDELRKSYNEEAVIRAGLSKDPRAVPLICRYLDQKRAIHSLGILGSPEAIIPLLGRVLDYPYDLEIVSDALQKIDPSWETRAEVKKMVPVFIERFKGFPKDEHGLQRNYLLRALFQLDIESSVRICMEIIKNPEKNREKSFFHTAITFLENKKIKEAKYPILKILENSPYTYIKTLSKIDADWEEDDQVQKFLNTVLKNPRKDIFTLLHLLKNRLISQDLALPIIKEILFDKKVKSHMRNSTLRTIIRILRPEESVWLVPFLKDQDPGIRRICVNHLGSGKIMKALPGIISALEDPNSYVKEEAVKILGGYNIPWAVESLLTFANDSANKKHSLHIIRGLAKISPNPPVHKIIEIWEKCLPEFSFQIDESLNLLLQLNHPVLTEYFMTRLCIFNKYQKVRIITAVVKQNEKRFRTLLRPVLKDPDPFMRAYAEWAIFMLSQ